MNLWIVTLFPEFFEPFMRCGVVGQVFSGKRGEKQLNIKLINPRDYALNEYKSVDDYPFGGSHGMIMRADILKRTLIEGILQIPCDLEKNYSEEVRNALRVILPSPRGVPWKAKLAKEMALQWDGDVVFIAGRYEGIDERFIERYVHEEYSLGDFILSGGEIAIMAMVDSVLRFMPGVLGAKDGALKDSFEGEIPLLEGPQYTRPRTFEDLEVPAIYLSGHHSKMQQFMQEERLRITARYRPDLFYKEEKE